MIMSVSLSIHDTRKPFAQLHQIFCAFCLWPWFGPSLTALRCVMYFRFMDDVMFSYLGSSGPESSMALRLEEFARWRYQLDVTQLQCLVEFVRLAPEVKSVIYDWLVISVELLVFCLSTRFMVQTALLLQSSKINKLGPFPLVVLIKVRINIC